MAAIVAAALLGLFGNGLLSKATAGVKGSNLWVEYNRFERYESPAELRIHIGAHGLGTALPALSINQDYLERVTVEHIEPKPEQVQAAGEHCVYIFTLGATNKPSTITFRLRGNGYGKVPVHLKVSGAPEVRFTQFFYP